MSVNQEFMDYVRDQLRDFGPVDLKKMFGGAGVYHKGLFFALIAEDILYLKVDDSNKDDFLKAASFPFKPYGNDKYVMSYYEVPASVLEERVELAKWASKAYAVALANRKPRGVHGENKKKKKRKAK